MPPPSYVRRGGLDISASPWVCGDVRAHVFYLSADTTALQALCDRTLNRPSNGVCRYRPVTDWVVLTFQRFQGMHSMEASAVQPSYSYSEASFWVMVQDDNSHRGSELLIPYMFVDNWIALAAGREIYGFPKELAIVDLPSASSPKACVTGLTHDGTTSDARNRVILQCTDAATIGGVPPLLADALQLLRLGPMRELLDMLLTSRLSFVFLRQLRTTYGGLSSDLQQIVSASACRFAIRAIPTLYFNASLLLPPLASHPIANDLGLNAPGGVVDIPVGFECVADFCLEPGRVIAP